MLLLPPQIDMKTLVDRTRSIWDDGIVISPEDDVDLIQRFHVGGVFRWRKSTTYSIVSVGTGFNVDTPLAA